MTYDFTKTSTEQLTRTLRFHENDTGTTTVAQECRRMYLVQEISAELQSRRDSLPPPFRRVYEGRRMAES